MRVLLTSPLSGVDFLIRDINYRNIYARLKQFLLPEEIALFAGIEVRGNEVVWYAEGKEGDWQKYRQASQVEKEQVADYLEEKRNVIRNKVAGVAGLAEYTGVLLRVPSDDDIFYTCGSDGTLTVVLTRWGCREAGPGKSIDILGTVIGMPRENQTEVVLKMVYKDGSVIAGETFWYTFYGLKKPVLTDERGEYRVGRLYYGKAFSVADKEDESGCVHTLTVIKGQEVYEMVFPCYTGFRVKVMNQYEEPYGNKAVGVGEKIYETNEAGEFEEEHWELLPENGIEVFLPEHRETGTYFQLHRERKQNEFVFIVEESFPCNLTARVVDKKGDPVQGYKLLIGRDKTEDYTTDAAGNVKLGSLNPGENLTVTDGNNPDNRETVEIRRGENYCELMVEPPVERQVRIQLLDLEREPIEGVQLKVVLKKGEYVCTTDASGYITLPYRYFTHREKIRVYFSIDDKSRKDENKA